MCIPLRTSPTLWPLCLSLAWAGLFLLGMGGSSLAQESKSSDVSTQSAAQNDTTQTEKKLSVEISQIETDNNDTEETKTQGHEFEGKIEVGGQMLSYTSAIKSIVVTKDDGKTKATIHFTEYLKEDVGDKAKRPITFCFNGGPGSSSVWLHIGGLSPKKVVFEPSELDPKAFKLADNSDSILDVTDLVFIDPVQTGFSRPEKEDEKAKFIGMENDIESIGEFVRLYLTRSGRWTSPLYILGESYGGIRGPGLAHYLYDRHYITTTGLILVSPVVDFQTLSPSMSNDLPYTLFLPSFAATAWHHRKTDPRLGRDLWSVLAEVEKFAQGRYTVALHKGDSLPVRQKEKLAETMSGMIGLSKEYILRANLKITMSRFGKELLRDEGEIVGRYDGRFRAPSWDGNNATTEFDPSGSLIGPGFATSLRQYFFDSYQLKSEDSYEILSGKVRPWDYGADNRYVELSGRLRETMYEVPQMRVFIACGYMDLATPYMGIRHTINHLGLKPDEQSRVVYGHYPAGHMMYIDAQSQKALKSDLSEFYK